MSNSSGSISFLGAFLQLTGAYLLLPEARKAIVSKWDKSE